MSYSWTSLNVIKINSCSVMLLVTEATQDPLVDLQQLRERHVFRGGRCWCMTAGLTVIQRAGHGEQGQQRLGSRRNLLIVIFDGG